MFTAGLRLCLLIAFPIVTTLQARPLLFSLTDPPGDQTGKIDVTGVVVHFDDSNGNYILTLTADPMHPFVGPFRVNLSLFNPDARGSSPEARGFSVNMRDYNLSTPATTLTIVGTDAHLVAWKAGDRVAADSTPFGNPPGTSFFRSAVDELPLPSVYCGESAPGPNCAEDTIAWGLSTTIQEDTSTTGTVSVVSAASFEPVIAPDSLATIFGAQLAPTQSVGELDSNGEWPREIAGTSVTINGRSAPLVFVSPGQINCVVPETTETGNAEVSVTSALFGTVSRGTVVVQRTAPAIFSKDGSGTGAGAILDAMTYRTEPFGVECPELTGSDKRTRLVAFGTGIRLAGLAQNSSATKVGGNRHSRRLHPDAWGVAARLSTAVSAANVAASVQALGVDGSGRSFTLPVEYAGPAPGFFGLDQVNVVLPKEADGDRTMTLKVTTDSMMSNGVTFSLHKMLVAPPPPPIDECAFSGACADLTGTWQVSEDVTLTCTITAEGESETDRERRSGSATVRITPERDCTYSYIPQGDYPSLKRTVVVSGNQVSVSGSAAIPIADLSDVKVSENVMHGQGQVCGTKMTLSSTGRYSVTGVYEGTQIAATCTVESQAQMTKLR